MSPSSTSVALFETMFKGLSLPAMLIAENSKVLSLNDGAAALLMMPVEDIEGQRWAGLDANMTLKKWRGIWSKSTESNQLSYKTDIETSRRFLRPIRVEVRFLDQEVALILLTDLICTDIKGSELSLLESELKIGHWSYNRVEGRLSLSPVCRKLLDIPDETVSKKDIGKLMSGKMMEADFEKLAIAATDLLSKPGKNSLDFVVDTADRTSLVNFSCQSVGNELHVTHLYGLIRRRFVTEADTSPASTHFAELAAFSLQQANDMIFWTRPDGTTRYVNKAVSAKLGYTVQEILEIPIEAYVHSFNQANRDEFWTKLRRNKSLEVDYVLTAKDGTSIQTSSTVTYIRFGEEEFCCSITRDVSVRLQEEKRQRLMEFTLDRTDDIVIWSRPDGSIYSANATYLEQTGFTSEQLGKMSISDIYAEADVVDKSLWERLRAGEVISKDTSIYTSSGPTIPVRARNNYLNYEGEELNCINMYDISSEIEKDRFVSLSQIALDTAADCILWLDEEYLIQYANQTFRKLLPDAMTRHMIGKDVKTVLPNLDRGSLKPGENHDFDLHIKDGEVRHMNLTCSLLEHDGNSYSVLTARDLSTQTLERQELETAYTEIEVMRDRLRDENVTLREENETKYNVNNIITVSPKYQKILTKVGQVADVDTTVLITGETGTGKELLARAVHQLSAREDFPLIKVNCAALPESLIESELFGHEKGAFTGAVGRKKGRFEMADRGTIFLDEIGELPIDLQSKLLRVLQEDEFERLGGEQTIKVDVRLIAATNRDLEQMVRDGKFREDLYYRLNVFPIHNLPLRERAEDIPVLIEYFTKKYAKRQGKRIHRINSADIKRMTAYTFPGNIRELENIIERSVVLCQSDTLSIDFVRNPRAPSPGVENFLTFEKMQRRHIINALKRTGGRVTGPEGAGVLLDMNDRTLVSKIRKLGIEKHEYLLG